jgi:hypothetical protein
MSAFPGPALHVIAIQLLAMLEPYEHDIAQLLRCWPDDARLGRVWEHVEHLRAYSSLVAEVRVQSTSMLIAHAELMRLLCRAQGAYEVGMGREIAECHANHRECLATLRFRLQWVINRGVAEEHPAPAAWGAPRSAW